MQTHQGSGRKIRTAGVGLLVWGLLVCGVVGGGVMPSPLRAQSLNDQQKSALKDFSKRAKAYEDQEHALPAAKLKPTSDIAELERRRVAMREAVQQSRTDAKQGDIFTPEAGDVFRLLLGKTMAGEHGAKIRASLKHAEPIAPADLKVNAVYPNMHGQPLQSTPPSLLANLPLLPKGLEYRVAGRTLALRDTEANLVVDLLPDALP